MSGGQRQDAAFLNIFGADRKTPVRSYPEQYTSRPPAPALRDDPYRTRSLQGVHSQQSATHVGGFRNVPPGHAQQQHPPDNHMPGGRVAPAPRTHRAPSEGYVTHAPIPRPDFDRTQSLQSSVQRPNFSRPQTTSRHPSNGSIVSNQHGTNENQDMRGPGGPSRRPPQMEVRSTSAQPTTSAGIPTSAKPSSYLSDVNQASTLNPIDSMRGNRSEFSPNSVTRTIHEESQPSAQSGYSSYFNSTPTRSTSSSTQATKVQERSFSMTSNSSKALQDRSFSFTGSSTTLTEKRPSQISSKSQYGQGGSGQAIYTTSKRAPMVYPALLSRVADVFRQRIILAEKTKDGLSYKDAFLGADAVDVIAYIIRTTDRNLALLLGRALDAQKFLHDVTYDHRLRDSSNEVYQFRENLAAGFSEADDANATGQRSNSTQSRERKRPSRAPTVDSLDSTLIEPPVNGGLRGLSVDVEEDLPNGVFTLLTECYSPTCTRDRLCYSIACPRRLEQQARLNMRPTPGLRRAESRGSLNDIADGPTENKLWINSVSQDVADSVDESEKKRQEVICEAIYTERDFVKDLEYLRDFWIKPLRTSSCIPEARREKFIRTVFSNVLEVHHVNSRLAEALTHRQQAQAIVHEIGDIFLEFIPHFDPFIRYGSLQLYAKFEFEREKSTNPQFAKFVEETERLKESRKLELNGYLTKPTTRLARYPLLLEAIQKHTKDHNSDKHNLPKAVTAIKVFLSRLNAESGKAENRFNLMQLQAQLVNKPGEPDPNLKLTDESRLLIFKGALKKKNVGNANAGTDASSDIQVFLFDHAILMVKPKMMNKRETLKVHRKPIPLELLVIQRTEEDIREAQKGVLSKRPSSSLLPGAGKSSIGISNKSSDGTKGYSITFQHLGRRGYAITLYATTQISRKKWLEQIDTQQRVLRDRHNVFQHVVVCEKYFLGSNKVSCVVPYDGGRKLIYGTDNGIYVSERRPNSTSRATPIRVLAIQGATQIDVIEEYGILLVLQDKTLVSFSMEALDVNDNNITNKRPRKVSSHTTFFKAGVCLGRVLVCVVKSSVLSSTIKVFEPVDHKGLGKKQPAFRKLLAGGNDLKVFKEFYIPTESSSIHFLKSKLCVGCAKGFEVVSLENLEVQSLLDPADSSLDFFRRRENVKPVAIYRLNGEFLLCYDEFAFFVNRNGWRARPNWVIHWEGICEATALHYPYILAFEPSFVEIYHVETGSLVQIVPGNHIRLVHEGRGKMGEGGEILITCDGNDIGQGDSLVATLSLTQGLVSPTRDQLE